MALSSTERGRIWRENNREKAREISRKHDEKYKLETGETRTAGFQRKKRLDGRAAETLYRTTKQRAKQNGIPFNLDPADVFIPSVCPILGVPLVLDKLRHQHGPSIDRIIPNLGYVKGNVRIISMRANRLKSDATIEEVEAILAYLRGIK